MMTLNNGSPRGDWGLTREKSHGSTCCENGMTFAVKCKYIATNYMVIYLSEL